MTALAISGCDLATIDIDTFMRAQDAAGGGLSLDARVSLVNKVTIFKGWCNNKQQSYYHYPRIDYLTYYRSFVVRRLGPISLIQSSTLRRTNRIQ